MAVQSKSKSKLATFKSNISEEVSVAGTSSTSTVNAGKSLPIYDEKGNVLGYVALYANVGLTA